MDADAATCLTGVEVYYVHMGSEDHITGSINNDVVGIGGNIIISCVMAWFVRSVADACCETISLRATRSLLSTTCA